MPTIMSSFRRFLFCCALLALFAMLLAAAPVVIPAHDAAGGGWADGGPVGDYFANLNLTGDPLTGASIFSRHDVRVSFDWSPARPVGGSRSEPYASFPEKNFSVRWTGRVIPRFDEAYTFTVQAGDGVRMKVKPADATAWVTALDHWGKAGTWHSAPIKLAAGKLCDVVLEYHQLTPTGMIEVRWGCPSAPEQIIDPVIAQGLNAASWAGYCFADEAKNARFVGNAKVDANGDTMADNQIFTGEGDADICYGSFALQFHGKAEVSSGGCAFVVADKTYQGTLPRGIGWDAASNTTHCLINHLGTRATMAFSKTARDGGEAKNDGITQLQLMMPLTPGGVVPHRVDELLNRNFKAMTANYTCLRWLQSANDQMDGIWANRTLPTYRMFTRGGWFTSETKGGECWEELIMMANECGKDLYLTLPMQANDAYFEQMARLVRYGSDGKDTYDHAVDHPKYPPLNSNLRLYYEVGNEIWNWGFGSSQDCNAAASKEQKAGTPDGKLCGGNYRNWHALRTVRASDAFRRVCGDAAMGAHIRPLLEYQYDNDQITAGMSYLFIDNQFNNADADHIAIPHPLRYYVWGSGGATYYGVGNPNGHQNKIDFPDPGFEKGSVEPGTHPAPADSGWVSTGNAGIYRNWWGTLSSFSYGKKGNVPNAKAAGCTFHVDKPLYLRQLGCWLQPDPWQEVGTYTVNLLGPLGVIASAKITGAGWSWGWGKVAGTPPLLEPGVDYQLLVNSDKGGINLYQAPTAVTPGTGLTITNAVRVPATATNDPKTWTVVTVAPGSVSCWPLAIHAMTTIDAAPTALPEPPKGGQAGFLRAGGTLSTKVTIPTPGRYAVELCVTVRGKNIFMQFHMTADGKNIDPAGQADARISHDWWGFNIGGWSRDNTSFSEIWGSAVFQVDKPGDVELRIFPAGGEQEQTTVFDELHLVSVDALTASGFGAGQANGQVTQNNYAKQLASQATYARSFGLPVVAYEAGWSVGGDFGSKPIQTWAKFKEDRVRDINNVAGEIFQRSGSFMNVWGVYGYSPTYDMAHAATYPLMQSVADLSSRLPVEADNGNLLPASLTAKNLITKWTFWWTKWDANAAKGLYDTRGQWSTWLVLAPHSGDYAFAVDTQGDGTWELEVDGIVVGKGVAAAAPITVHLVKGQYGVRLRNRGGIFTLKEIKVVDDTAN